MLTWMTTLPGHSYSLREDRPPTINPKQEIKEEMKPDISNLPTTELVIKEETIPESAIKQEINSIE